MTLDLCKLFNLTESTLPSHIFTIYYLQLVFAFVIYARECELLVSSGDDKFCVRLIFLGLATISSPVVSLVDG